MRLGFGFDGVRRPSQNGTHPNRNGADEALLAVNRADRRSAAIRLDWDEHPNRASQCVFTSTALLAARAGGQVVALGRDSQYGRFADVEQELLGYAKLLGVSKRISCTSDRQATELRGIDVIANNGFVRPIDRELLHHVGAQCVVSYMCESWEVRDDDVDFNFCSAAGIPVYFSDENGWGMNVFDMCGQLAIKLCSEAGLELVANYIATISSDRFGPVIQRTLEAAGAETALFKAPLYEGLDSRWWDALLIAEYSTKEVILGDLITPERVKRFLTPGGVVVQFAGANHVAAFGDTDFKFLPATPLEPQRMYRTLAYLGDLPVVRLHGIGLKVCESACRGKREGKKESGLDQYVLSNSPAQCGDWTELDGGQQS